MAARGLGEGGVHLLLGHHVHIAVNAAEFASQRLAEGFVHVEDGDFDAMAGQTPGRGGSQAGSAPGDDGRDVGVQLHGFSSMGEKQALLAGKVGCALA